jgi:hypothetical protein
MKAEIERSGRMDRIPVEQRAQLFETQAKMLPVIGWTGALLGGPLVLFVVGAIYLLALRFFLASEVSFKRVLVVVAWSFLVVSLVTTPLTLTTLFLKDDWTLNPRLALQANLAMLLDAESAPKALMALLDSIDLFSFWLLFMLYTGFRIATPQRAGAVAGAVLGPWVIYVLGKTLLAALF